jgi:hypothetical protein
MGLLALAMVTTLAFVAFGWVAARFSITVYAAANLKAIRRLVFIARLSCTTQTGFLTAHSPR